MKQRSLPKMFGLFIITLGIYRLYWFAKTRQEILTKQPSLSIPSVWLLIAPYVVIALSIIILVVTMVGGFVDAHNACEVYGTNTTDYNRCFELSTEEPSGTQTLALVGVYLSAFILVPLTAWWIWFYSKAVEKVTREKLSFPLAMIVLLAVPDGFDILIIQDSFNKQASSKTA